MSSLGDILMDEGKMKSMAIKDEKKRKLKTSGYISVQMGTLA